MAENVNNNNRKIIISELLQKIANVEETFFSASGIKSIFDKYNTTKSTEDNAIEYLSKEELTKFVNDIKKYDTNNNEEIELSEIDMFVAYFNANNGDRRIKTDDLYNFIKSIYKKDEIYSGGIVETSNIETIGSPLSKKNIKLQFLIDNQVKVIEIELSLYATKNPNIPEVIINKVTSGGEYKQLITKKYGYTGDKAWSKFINSSIVSIDKNTYEIGFDPQFSSTSAKKGISSVNTNTSINMNSVDGVDTYVFPEGYDKDPRIIYEQYAKPEVQQVMSDFIEYIEYMIDISENNLNAYLDTYGFSEKIADGASKIWNNQYVIPEGNTESGMKQMLEKARHLVEEMKNADNSLEGVLQHKDYMSFYKELTGLDFNPRFVKSFLVENVKYAEEKSLIALYMHVHKSLKPAMDKYQDKHRASNESNSYEQMLDRNSDELYETLNELLYMPREDWDNIVKELKQKNIPLGQFFVFFTDNLINIIDEQVKSKLGLSNIEDVENYEKNLSSSFKTIKKSVLGNKGDLINRIDNYHESQVIGGLVVDATMQIALYAIGLPVFGNALSSSKKIVDLFKHVEKFKYLSGTQKGVASGLAYASSYLGIEITNRSTNNIDNSIDLFNFKVAGEIGRNTLIEFVVGTLFDGPIKEQIFSKLENKALEMEKGILDDYSKIGNAFLDEPNKRFSSNQLITILGVRTTAGISGGTKDGTKETCKEVLRSDINLSDIGLAFFIGMISNAFFIRFKNSDWAKKEHQVIGKFVEKAPKKNTKTYINPHDENENTSQKDKEANEYEKNIQYIMDSVRANLEMNKNRAEYEEIKKFIDEDPNKFRAVVIECYNLYSASLN